MRGWTVILGATTHEYPHVHSFVGSPRYPKSYIVSQLPLQQTVGDFWRLVELSVMATIPLP